MDNVESWAQPDSSAIREVEEDIHRLQVGETTILLIGTAHVSRASAALVSAVIEQERPEVVCVELCDPRHQSLQKPDRWKETDIVEVIRSGRAYVLLAQLILAGYQRRIAHQFGIEPGAEMRAALLASERIQARVIPIDREIKTTLKRAWASAHLWTIAKIICSGIESLTSKEQFSEQQIDEMKQGDALSSVLGEFAEHLPEVKEVLIDERDRFMTLKLLASVVSLHNVERADEISTPTFLPPRKVVAVVGAGHIPGMKKTFTEILDANSGASLKERIVSELITLPELERIPPRSQWFTFLGLLIPGLVGGGLIAGFFLMDTNELIGMFWQWTLITGGLAAIGTALAKAHPVTILTSFVSAPITCLHPAIAVGWVAGLVEATLRKPRVKDLETLVDDFNGVRGLWNNRVSRILLVVILANVGGALGGIAGLSSLARLW